MPNEIHVKFIKVYGDSSPLFSTLKKWAAKLKLGRKSLEAHSRSKTHLCENLWTVFGAFLPKKLILCIDSFLWMRLRFTITHQNPHSSQNSGQKPVFQLQWRQDRFHQQERSWHRCFGMLNAFCLLIILKRVKQ